jgi:putative membrane protein
MHGLMIRWLVSAASLWLTSKIIPGFYFDGVFPLLFAAVTIGLLNAIVRPIVVVLTLPLTILTLGLFIFVINAGMLLMAAKVVNGFHVEGFWAALGGWLFTSVFTLIISSLIGEHGRFEVVTIRRTVS